MPKREEFIEVDGREVKVTNPDKVFFPARGTTKLDLVRYYERVAPGILNAARGRPTLLYRWPNGVEGEPFYQKRVPESRPEWIETVTVHFPSGRSATMLEISDTASILWAINLGCIDLNPWPVRAEDVDHPDELRVDLDPTPGIPYTDVCRVAPIVHDVLTEHGLRGFPKTSGKRGMHIYVPIEARWSFTMVRRAALALAREVERRADGVATTSWWKEERVGVFVDYNQNARDRTIASVYSVRPTADARVSCALEWDEIAGLEPERFTIDTVPERIPHDPWREYGSVRGSLDALLDLADRDEKEGLGDAPWPPHFPKGDREPARVQPSKRRKT